MRAEPTRYREVVLTSCHSMENNGQRSISAMLVKLHQYCDLVLIDAARHEGLNFTPCRYV